jgi:hypothetical protein
VQWTYLVWWWMEQRVSDQWLHSWFPLVGMGLQVIYWGQVMPRIVSRKTMAILTFTSLPEDPNW